MFEQILPLFAALTAGAVWAGVGTFAAWRRHQVGKNPEWKGFEPKKLRDDLLVGLGIGFAAQIYGIVQGDAQPIITTFDQFVLAAAGLFTSVVVVDKIFVEGVLGK